MSVETTTEQTPVDDFSSKLQNEFFGDASTQTVVVNNQQQAAESKTETQKTEQTQEQKVIDPKEWLKREFDTDDIEVIKAEREELKTLRNTTKEREFANDDSRKAYEYLLDGKEDDLYSFLSNKKKVEKLLTADVNDKSTATELVKFGLQKDNPNLSTEDIDFIFNKKYSIPEKPTQGELEDDADYENRVKSWQTQVSNTEKELVIDAKMHQPKLAQLKNELVLPDIKRDNPQQNQMSQEDLETEQKERDNFLKFAEKAIDTFNGFNVPVKDKDVDYEVPYSLSKEEKKSVSDKVKQFAESGFNANGLFADRWVNEDGKSLNVEQMVKDLSRVYGGEKIEQKIALDSANKRIEQYLKEKKQVSVNNQTSEPSTIVDAKSKSEKMAEVFWGD